MCDRDKIKREDSQTPVFGTKPFTRPPASQTVGILPIPAAGIDLLGTQTGQIQMKSIYTWTTQTFPTSYRLGQSPKVNWLFFFLDKGQTGASTTPEVENLESGST